MRLRSKTLCALAFGYIRQSQSKELSLTAVRSIDGSDANEGGKVPSLLIRKAGAAYPGNGSGKTMKGSPKLPNPRDLSNKCHKQEESKENDRGLTDMTWAFGQFLDHDMDLTPSSEESGTAHIPITDENDEMGTTPMEFIRAIFDPDTGKNGIPRAHINIITPLIDGSAVYGSDQERANALRSFEKGKLKVSNPEVIPSRRLPPLNTEGQHNEGGDDVKDLFLVGDVRGNEQIGLLAMHTVFLREHNRLCDRILKVYPNATDEEVYQFARKIVGAEIQKITYEEFLPAVLGPMAPNVKDFEYDENVPVNIATEFSGAAYRFGHTMLSPELKLVSGSNRVYRVPLRFAFFRTDFFMRSPFRVNHLLRGFVTQAAQAIDGQIVEEVRNFLFGQPGDGGLDLAALNIQRGRDLGLPGYNHVRKAYNLEPHTSFNQITKDKKLRKVLKHLYRNPDKLDLWVGCLIQDHAPGAAVGDLVGAILNEQFTRLMNGDKFFYLNDPDLKQSNLRGIINLRKLRFYDTLRRNARISVSDDASKNVFFLKKEKGE